MGSLKEEEKSEHMINSPVMCEAIEVTFCGIFYPQKPPNNDVLGVKIGFWSLYHNSTTIACEKWLFWLLSEVAPL